MNTQNNAATDIAREAQKARIAARKAEDKAYKEKRNKLIMMFFLFVLAAVAIVYIFPSGVKFRYAYEIGKPWNYESLTAPKDFAILKTKKEIESETKELIRQNYAPYFRIDKKTSENMIKMFEQASAVNATKNAEPYTSYIAYKLKQIYSDGIVSASDMAALEHDQVTNVKLRQVAEDTAGTDYYEDSYIERIFTEKTAYENIIEKAPKNLDKNELRNYDINKYIAVNLTFEREISDKQKEEISRSISRSKGMVQEGEKIIGKGDIVNNKTNEILESLKYEIEQNSKNTHNPRTILGQTLCVICILCAFFLYLAFFRFRFISFRNVSFMLLLITGMCALTGWMVKTSGDGMGAMVYAIPFAIVPVTISTFFDTRTALFTHLTTVLLCSLISAHEFEFLLLQIIIGMICISTLTHFYQRSQLVKTALIIAAIYIVTYIGLALTHSSGFDWSADGEIIIYFILNATLLLLAYPLIFIMEKVFGFVSDITLVELTNTNSPLLRQFSEVAPGSFQHSLQVANLASDAADHIGANAMLARAGALYHDVGKMSNPIYFTENQNGFSPHIYLSTKESVKMITSHVQDGISLAKRYGLPAQIRDFIISHHGRNIVRYFYNSYVNAHPGEEVNTADFSYSGKLPSTKETAIVMMCDGVEAASRSLTEYTDESINNLVEKIISPLIKDGALADAPITLKEIETVKNTLKEKLKNMYHTRIRYPELKKTEQEKKDEQENTAEEK